MSTGIEGGKPILFAHLVMECLGLAIETPELTFEVSYGDEWMSFSLSLSGWLVDRIIAWEVLFQSVDGTGIISTTIQEAFAELRGTGSSPEGSQKP